MLCRRYFYCHVDIAARGMARGAQMRAVDMRTYVD